MPIIQTSGVLEEIKKYFWNWKSAFKQEGVSFILPLIAAPVVSAVGGHVAKKIKEKKKKKKR